MANIVQAQQTGWQEIVILLGQLANRPLANQTTIDLKTIIGQKTKMPMKLLTPVIPVEDIFAYQPDQTTISEQDLTKAAVEIVIGVGAAAKLSSMWDLLVLVQKLRETTGGKPIGIRLAAYKIEEDLAWVKKSAADFVTIVGSTSGGVSVPLPFALQRARQFFDKNDMEEVDLIAAGGLNTAEDVIKALAMGAGAVQLERKANLNHELSTWLRAIGKDKIHDLNISDLATLSSEISNYTNIKHV
jgi:hypothetical protein